MFGQKILMFLLRRVETVVGFQLGHNGLVERMGGVELGIALDQSRKVGGLAQSRLELVRLEHSFVQPVLERFSLTDLVQDIFQKFELTAEARQIELKATFAPNVSAVCADLGLIERVLQLIAVPGRGATFRFSLPLEAQTAEKWAVRSMNLNTMGK